MGINWSQADRVQRERASSQRRGFKGKKRIALRSYKWDHESNPVIPFSFAHNNAEKRTFKTIGEVNWLRMWSGCSFFFYSLFFFFPCLHISQMISSTLHAKFPLVVAFIGSLSALSGWRGRGWGNYDGVRRITPRESVWNPIHRIDTVRVCTSSFILSMSPHEFCVFFGWIRDSGLCEDSNLQELYPLTLHSSPAAKPAPSFIRTSHTFTHFPPRFLRLFHCRTSPLNTYLFESQSWYFCV